MSQITRCPACATSFKVVADQLRISEGWVRCGQCKEVFDAAAHLLPAPPPPLLPDVSLTDVRPPPAPVVRKTDTGRAWGESASAPQVPAAPARAVATPPAPLYAAQEFSLFPAAPPAEVFGSAGHVQDAARDGTHGAAQAPVHAPAVAAYTVVPEPEPESELEPTQDSVLTVPAPTVPAFLSAGGAASQRTGDDLQLEPLTPFAWRARQGAALPQAAAEMGPQAGLPGTAAASPAEQPALPARVGMMPAPGSAAAPLNLTPVAIPTPPTDVAALATTAPVPAGYELPFADLRDEDDALDIPSFESTVPAELTPMGYPALELPIRPVTTAASPLPPARPVLDPDPDAFGIDLDAVMLTTPSAAESVAASAKERAAEALPSASARSPSQASAPPASPDHPGLSLVEDDSPAAVLQPKPRKAQRDDAGDDDAQPAAAHEEVSFVVAARRKAFWRKPAVRAVLAGVAVAATAALALQVAVQERDRIVAMDARARPWLMKLCAPLQCDIAPRRQIADVVIDSSSFNKARGDSYQLTVAMKSKSTTALAMPAVELTLTDAQDQPVLRRVLLPADMGAPSELPAHGEWSTAVSVVVTTGGARVAGYRLLAFYP